MRARRTLERDDPTSAPTGPAHIVGGRRELALASLMKATLPLRSCVEARGVYVGREQAR
jgi:hypothetical protein